MRPQPPYYSPWMLILENKENECTKRYDRLTIGPQKTDATITSICLWVLSMTPWVLWLMSSGYLAPLAVIFHWPFSSESNALTPVQHWHCGSPAMVHHAIVPILVIKNSFKLGESLRSHTGSTAGVGCDCTQVAWSDSRELVRLSLGKKEFCSDLPLLPCTCALCRIID